MTITKNLLCCDWGTSSFRLRLVDTSDYSVIAEQYSADGVAGTFKAWQSDGNSARFDFYASRLRLAIHQLSQTSASDLLNTPIIVSGMASSSLGMEEIPYAPLPFALDGSEVSSKIFPDFNGRGNALILVSGVRSDNDVMRGEEAQLIGLYKLNQSLSKEDSLLVFPGTHSKHMQVKDSNLTGFRTFMTGEIFNILSEHSILKDSITGGGSLSVPENKLAFIEGVNVSSTSTLLNTLFTIRTNQLFSKLSKEQNAFYLSGLLIGTELRELREMENDQIIICSGHNLYGHYKIACEALELTENITFIQPEEIDKATIAGQVQAFCALNNIYE